MPPPSASASVAHGSLASEQRAGELTAVLAPSQQHRHTQRGSGGTASDGPSPPVCAADWDADSQTQFGRGAQEVTGRSGNSQEGREDGRWS